ncbi:MAG: radical SAM protein [Desulfovibrionaceae bacterium]|nr:radical SAM protein [Desulfovibrionaceae bacterium]MDD4951925.1 radical SAM protein [Desulfovibrionaceae bacterium]
MSSKKRPRPRLVFADQSGQIFDHPDLLMLCRRGRELGLPKPDELVALPPESECLLLPHRSALGLDPDSGRAEALDETAVAAFVCPGYTLTGVAAYQTRDRAPTLPLFAYGAVGFADGRLWVCAKRVDADRRQKFSNIPRRRIENGAQRLLARFPENRLVRHLIGCALTNGCPAAKNLALGRFEAPLPTSRTCNARCLGCLSLQPEDSGFPATQRRIEFTPTAQEIVEIMSWHEAREKRPIFSFGQGCEGEPLTEAELLAEAIRKYRREGGTGTVNINTNGSRPAAMPVLAVAGLTSIRVSLNSARKGPYEAYHRPVGYLFEDVLETVAKAKEVGLFVSLNLLYFPGFTDTEAEMEALDNLVRGAGVDFVQLRNLNLDPELYMAAMARFDPGPAMGLANFKKRLLAGDTGLKFGYFNPYLG